jgi:competence protein ComEC
MSIIEPRVLWDVGFQLSFLATLGLILYVEPMQIGLEHLLAFVFEGDTPRKIVGTVSDALLVTIAAQITTTPVMAYTFEQFSVLSLPVNLLIIPVQTPIMVLGGIGTALALLFAPLGQIVLWGSWLFITYSWWIIRSFAGLPLASVEVHPSAELTLTIYIILFALTTVWKLRPTEREAVRMWMKQDFLPRFTAGSCAIFGILLLIGSWQVADGRLHMHFLNLNDGSATLIITPSGRHILVDTGNSPRQLSTGLGEVLPFWDRRLDLVVITSSDRDHISGLVPLLDRYEVGAVLINQTPGEDTAEQTAWAALQSRQIPVIVGQLGTSVVVDDGVTLEVLYAQSNMNDSGEPLVITLNYGDARILLSGNMTETAERTLFSESWLLDSTVLLVPNGGDAEASSEKFIEAVHPQIAIIMVGASSRTGLPDLETLQRLEDSGALVIRSDEQGEIHIWTDGEYLWQRTSNP